MWTWVRIRRAVTNVSRKQVIVGIGIAIARASGFASGAIVARALGPEGFAPYTIAFTIFSSLLQLTTFADTWLVSRWGDANTRERAKAAVWRIKIGAGGLLMLGAALVPLVLTEWSEKVHVTPALYLLAVGTAVAGALTTAGATTFQADGRFSVYSVIVAVGPLISVVLSFALWRSHAHSPVTYVWVLLISYVPTAVLAYRQLRVHPVPPALRADLLRALQFGGWVTVGSVAYALFQRIDVFLLAGLASPSEVGMYGAATRLAAVGSFFGSTLTAVLMPAGSLAATWVDRAKRHDYFIESLVSILVMSGALIVAIAVTGPTMRALFGDPYRIAVPMAQILIFSQVVLIAQMPFYFAMYALQGERWIAALGLGQLVASVGSCYLLIPRLGPLGAAWSNVVTYGLGLLVVTGFHLRRQQQSFSS